MDLFGYLRVLLDFVKKSDKTFSDWLDAVDAFGAAVRLGASWLKSLGAGVPLGVVAPDLSDELLIEKLEGFLPCESEHACEKACDDHKAQALAAVEWTSLLPLLFELFSRFLAKR